MNRTSWQLTAVQGRQPCTYFSKGIRVHSVDGKHSAGLLVEAAQPGGGCEWGTCHLYLCLSDTCQTLCCAQDHSIFLSLELSTATSESPRGTPSLSSPVTLWRWPHSPLTEPAPPGWAPRVPRQGDMGDRPGGGTRAQQSRILAGPLTTFSRGIEISYLARSLWSWKLMYIKY